VFGGPHNASFKHIDLPETVRSNLVGRSFRRAAENGAQAARGPNSTASFRLRFPELVLAETLAVIKIAGFYL